MASRFKVVSTVMTFPSGTKERVFRTDDKDRVQDIWDDQISYCSTSAVQVYALNSQGKYQIVDVWKFDFESDRKPYKESIPINWGSWIDSPVKQTKQGVLVSD